MRYTSPASLFLAAALATTSLLSQGSLAAPSQLVFSEDAPVTNRDPDFVDQLESEVARIKASKSNAAASFWPGQPGEPGGGGGWVWSTCGTEEDLIDIQKIEVSPDPPVPGKNLTVTAKGLVKGAIEEGSFADVTVKIGLIKLLSKQFDICEEAKNNNVTVQCPVQPGEYEITQVVQLPREIPPAKFNVHVNAFGANDEDLTCLDLAIDFRKR